MESPGERIFLSSAQHELLSAMGIQAWYARRDRSPAVIPEPEAEPMSIRERETAAAPAAAIDPVHLVWIRGATGMALVDEADPLRIRFVMDLVAALDWRTCGSAGPARRGEFRWPRLRGATGTPAGALRALFEREMPQGAGWLLVTAPLEDRLSAWLDTAPARQCLPDLDGALKDPAVRKALWLSLTAPA